MSVFDHDSLRRRAAENGATVSEFLAEQPEIQKMWERLRRERTEKQDQ